MRRTRVALTSAAASILLLAGCAGLPSTSSVATGKAVSAPESPDPLTVMPDGPLPGDDPRGIVTGFLRAQMWQPNGRALARSFLTATGSRQWQPGNSVTVYDESAGMSVTRPDVHTVRVRVPVVAEMSADGHVQRRATPEFRTMDFTAQKGAAGWRLSQLPANLGLWLSQDDFARLYTSVNVYYPSSFGHVMVPDPRWMPRQGLATALARATLSAPPKWLAPAVHVPFPHGTSLDVDAVPVSGKGRANIDLSAQIQQASAADRSAAWASVAATLAQAPEVRSVLLSSKGARVEAENLPDNVAQAGDVGYQMPDDPSRVVISRGGSYLAWSDPTALSARTGSTKSAAAGRPPLPSVPVSWKALAAGPAGRQIAAVSDDHTSLRRWLNGTNVTLSALGTDLVRPAFDSFGVLWCAGRSFADQPDTTNSRARGPAALWALPPGHSDVQSAPTALSVPWLGSAQVVALSPSPEGERVALVLREGSRRHLVVAAVERAKDGTPVRLGTAEEVPGVEDPSDVAWLDADRLAVLGNSGGTRGPVQVTLDGQSTALGRVPGASSLVSTRTGSTGLFVATSNGSVYTRRGAGWSSFLTGGELVVPAS